MTWLPKPNSITGRIILVSVALLIVSGLIRVLLLSNYLREDISALSSAQLLTLANYVARDVDRDLIERRELLERLEARLPAELLTQPAALQNWLSEAQGVHPIFSLGLAVLNSSGTVITGYPAFSVQTGKNYADQPYIRRALNGEFALGAAVSNGTVIGGTSDRLVLPMAMPLRDETGQVHGVLVGVTALDDPAFLDSLQKTQIGQTGGLLLISPQDRLFIGATEPDIRFQPTPPDGLNPLHDRAMRGYRGAGLTVNARGVEELVGIASVPTSDWFVVARLPTSEAYAPLARLNRFVLSNTVLIIPGLILLLIVLLRIVFRPLRNAARHADQMTRGEMPLEPLPVVRQDEIGHLTTAFNRLLSKLLESRAELEHLAHHDVLTGLPNRSLLADRMQQALARAQRNQQKIAVLFLDLDGFKPINDTLGHEAGDLALCAVSARLSGVIRQEDTLSRVGGDEFVILLTDLSDQPEETAERVARKCLEVFKQPFLIGDQMWQLGTSIGIALGDGACLADPLLIAADQAMYVAKQNGRRQFVWAVSAAPTLPH